MKRIKLIPVLLVLILAIVAVGQKGYVWAKSNFTEGNKARGFDSPMYMIKTLTQDGLYNIGGVCTIEVDYQDPIKVKTIADAEVPVTDSKKVPFFPVKDPNYTDEALLFPGCHFVHYKMDDTTQEYKITNPLKAEDGTAKVCFGATPTITMAIYYYLDSPVNGNRVWIELPSHLEDENRLICSSAPYTGVYMPSGKIRITPNEGGGTDTQGTQTAPQGSVRPPATKIHITTSGTYSVGGICTIQAKYKVTGLTDDVEVEFSNDHLTEETLKVPSDAVAGIFYFPGCHVIHYRDLKIRDEMNPPEGEWQICFAAIPEKVMTIYYYKDNLTTITPPWIALETTTKNGIACANLVDWSAVYTPAGK